MMKKSLLTAVFLLVSCLCLWAQETVVWERPLAAFSQLSGRLDVTKVEFLKDKTIVHFHAQLPSNTQFGFTSNVVLQADLKDYKAKDITVMKFDEPYTLSETGQLQFAMIFEPLPAQTESFAFTMPGAFTISNIHDGKNINKSIKDTNWRDDSTGDWLIGFGEKHVIYDCKTWDIINKVEKKGAYTILASDGSATLSIVISKIKDRKRTFKIGKKKAVCSIITGHSLPDYPEKDLRSDISDNNYRTGDSVTIVGWYRNMPEQMRQMSGEWGVKYPSIFTDKELCFAAKMDSLGRFTLRFPVQNSVELFCDWERSHLAMVVEPGETYFLLKDFCNDQTLYMGKNARLMNELTTCWEYCNGTDPYEYLPKLGAMPYVHHCDSALNDYLTQLDSVAVAHPTFSNRYFTYLRNDGYVSVGRDMMQGRFRESNLPDEYLNFVTEKIWPNIIEPYTLNNHFFNTLLRDYTDHFEEKSYGQLGARDMALMEEAAKEGIVTLTDEDRKTIADYFAALDDFFKKVVNLSPKEQEKMDEEFGNSEINKKFNEIYLRPGLSDYLRRRQQELEVGGATAVLDKYGFPQTIKDIALASKLCRVLDGTREQLPESQLKLAKESIKMPAALDAVMAMNQKYKELEERASAPVVNVAKNVADMTDGEKIMHKILEPHRGKIVLVDVWGTWCSPCKELLSHSQEEYERLKDYPMVYVYLANRSPEKSWQNVINEYNVKGDNVFHYNLPDGQQAAVENYLKVSGFPSYFLFDQQGRLLDVNASPRDLSGLERVIKKLAQ